MSLLFGSFDEIIHLLKEKKPFYGEVLEYLYLSAPLYYSRTFDLICNRYRYIDNLLRVLFKDCNKRFNDKIKNDVFDICEEFNIEVHEFDYYYVVALMIIDLEKSINEDAFNLYAQFDDNTKVDIDRFLNLFINTLNIEEFQALFYNHLEDVYITNSSEDQSFSVLNSKNYSYFLDNLENKDLFELVEKDEENDKYPIVISNNIVYNVLDDGTPNVLLTDIDIGIDPEIVIVGIYDNNNKSISIKHYIQKLFNDNEYIIEEETIEKFNNNEIIDDIIIDNQDLLKQSKSFYIYKSDDIISYYIRRFTVFTTEVIDLINT